MIIPLGTKIEPYGTVGAVGWVGERYYWLNDENMVTMLPATVLEPIYQKQINSLPDNTPITE